MHANNSKCRGTFLFLSPTTIASCKHFFFPYCSIPQVLTCRDPGNVEHSRKIITGSRFAAGSTVQFTCNKGYVLSGSSILTCYNREAAVPKWSDRLPKCVRKLHAVYLAHLTSTPSHRLIDGFALCFAAQLKSTSRAETPAQPPPARRAPKRPFTKRERR